MKERVRLDCEDFKMNFKSLLYKKCVIFGHGLIEK